MSSLKCEHSVIILDPHVIYYAKKYGTIVVRNKVFMHFCKELYVNKAKFSPRRLNITFSDLNSCYFLNKETGETRPLYMEVPCGKCRLCRAKKSREMMSRCTAETNRWGTIPLFITFTYSDRHLPSDGLCKRDLQLFLKRLRSRLDYYKIEHNLRYFAVGEYGSKTHRAHYHMILWNFPQSNVHFPNIISVQRFIEKCWSRFVIEYGEDGKPHRIPLRASGGEILRYPSGSIIYQSYPIGWIKILPVTKGCPAYVTKYMRKPCFVPEGCNPCFSLASNRGGGIGSAYIDSFRDTYANTPTMESLPVPDKVTNGGIFNMPITQYVKSRLDPSPSRYLNKKQYQIYKDFLHNLSIFQSLCSRIRDFDMLHLDRYDSKLEGIKHWYDPFSDINTHENWSKALKRCDFLKSPLQVEHHIYDTYNPDEIWDHLFVICDRLDIFSQKILAFPEYNTLFRAREDRSKRRQDYFARTYANVPDPNIPELVDRLNREVDRNRHKEFF